MKNILAAVDEMVRILQISAENAAALLLDRADRGGGPPVLDDHRSLPGFL